jgi:hypothetical protein
MSLDVVVCLLFEFPIPYRDAKANDISLKHWRFLFRVTSYSVEMFKLVSSLLHFRLAAVHLILLAFIASAFNSPMSQALD